MEEACTRVLPAPSAQQTRIGAIGEAREIAPRSGPGALARLRVQLAGLPLRTKAIGGAAATLALCGLAALALRSGEGTSCPSIIALDDDVRSYSFGHTDARIECGRSVKFGFNAAASRRILLHYQASGAIEGASLEVRFNGKHLTWARPASEEQVLPLPDRALRTDAGNIVAFVQTDGEKPWAVAKVRAEVLALAPGDAKAAREAKGLSLADLKELTGMDRSALSKLETGQRGNPTVDTLLRYAEAVGKRLVVSLRDG